MGVLQPCRPTRQTAPAATPGARRARTRPHSPGHAPSTIDHAPPALHTTIAQARNRGRSHPRDPRGGTDARVHTHVPVTYIPLCVSTRRSNDRHVPYSYRAYFSCSGNMQTLYGMRASRRRGCTVHRGQGTLLHALPVIQNERMGIAQFGRAVRAVRPPLLSHHAA